MMGIFDVDGWFYKWGTKIFDIIIISLITLILSVLSFTVLTGASLCAFFYTMDKVVIQEHGYLLKNYLKSFKNNLKQGTLFWLLLLIGYSLVTYFLYILGRENISGLVLIASYFVMIELIIITCYGFVLLAKFEMSIKEIIIKSLLFGHKHMLTTLAILSVIILVFILIIKVHPVFVIFGFGIAGYIISRLIMEMVLPKYIDKEKLTDYK